MSVQMVLLPVFVLVGLTFALLLGMASLRTRAIVSGETKPRDIALRQPNWPPYLLQLSYSFSSQYEMPVLFYVLTILVVITKQADVLFVVLSWVFVISRAAHAFVHVTSNDLRWRGPLFGVGALVIAIMWLIFIVKILLDMP